MAIKFIYFDLGNVLLHFDHRLAAAQIAKVAGISFETVWERLFGSGLLAAVDAGQLSDREFYEHFCHETGTRPDYAEFLLAESDIFKLNRPLVPLVAQLEAAGYPLGIISNTCQCHWEFVTQGQYGIVPAPFRSIVLSYEVKSVKPEPRIYELAIERSGVAPGEIFFCDDRPENVAGAIAAGIDAALFHDATQLARELRERGVKWNY